jgi:alpha-1,2-mannosyltransferase
MLGFFRELTVGQRRLTIIALLLVGVQIGVTCYNRTRRIGDFDVLRGFGERMLHGEPLYGSCYNYMPITALYNMPSALTSAWVASLWRSLIAVVCLAFTVRWLSRMTADPTAPQSPSRAFVPAALALVLASHYLVRDLDDAGPHTILLTLLVGGAYCVWQSRERWAAAWFGLAIALKMTPGLLLPFFVWKRQFRLAAYSAVAAVAWIALPTVWMGPQAWWEAQSQWNQVALRALSGASDSNEERIQNQALKPAIERMLIAYPPGDPRISQHPLDGASFDLPPATARKIALGVMLALLAACAWYARKPYAGPRDPARLPEFAGLMLMMTLCSPVTWLQHLAWVVPATWLIARAYLSGERRDPRFRVALGLYIFLSLVLNRELVGRENYYLLLSWHMHTVCQLLLLGMLAAVARRKPTASATPQTNMPSILRRAA